MAENDAKSIEILSTVHSSIEPYLTTSVPRECRIEEPIRRYRQYHRLIVRLRHFCSDGLIASDWLGDPKQKFLELVVTGGHHDT